MSNSTGAHSTRTLPAEPYAPETTSGDAPHAQGYYPPRSSSSGSKALKIIIGVLVGILILFMLVEFGLRHYVAAQIKSSFIESAPAGAVIDEEPDVSFGPSPLLFAVASKKVDSVTVRVPSTLTSNGGVIEGNPPAKLELRGFTLDSDPVADSLTLTSDLPNQYVREMLQSQLSHAMDEQSEGDFAIYKDIVTISDVESKPSDGTFEITISNGGATIELKPEMENDTLYFTAVRTKIMGITLPDFVSEIITQQLRKAMEEQVIGSLAVKNFDVLPDNFRVTLSGDNVPLKELAVAN
ncbi:DUF2993 domain-containing protein [Corynebacterium aquatimens]|uniref:DUF2993 domain-containing protein n=1 Tax=Corynebacterium aquatimens TaxID=1190508 RepID=A0A931GWE3_9CORY|nr:DUF2993 domain-containing protein [Corynebacterium aquatimens]MBG6122476.1 hypothetical protein [Corynebacterium aquatimens]